MKKLSAIIFLVLFSIKCFAIAEKMDETSCEINNAMGGCFQNKTGSDLKNQNVCVLLKSYVSNRTEPFLSPMPINQLAPEHFISISWTQEDLKKYQLIKLDYIIVESCSKLTTNLNQFIAPGCRITIPSSQKTIIPIYKKGNHFDCNK